MSVSSIRQYFKDSFARVDSSRIEWRDAFNTENVPETILEKSYHIAFGSTSAVTLADSSLDLTIPVDVTFWVRGYLDSTEAIDTAMDLAESLSLDAITVDNSMYYNGFIKRVALINIDLAPIDASNDNIVKVVVGFDVLYITK